MKIQEPYIYNFDMIGYVPDGYRKVLVNGNRDLLCKVTVLSTLPESLQDVYFYEVTLYANELKKDLFEDDYLLSNEEREENLKAFIKDRYIMFKPEARQGTSGDQYFKATDVRLFAINERFEEVWAQSMVPLPIFNSVSSIDNFNQYDFEQALLNGKPVGKNTNVSTDPDDYPKYVIWSNEAGELFLYGTINGQVSSSTDYITYSIGEQSLKKYSIKDKLDEVGYGDFKEIIFVEKDILEHRIGKMKEELFLNIPIEQSNSQKSMIPKTYENNEMQFIHRLKTIASKNRLYYDPKDLYNFHTAMKVGNLVVLSGLSGTGKSQLINTYAQALSLDPTQQKRFIPVRPFWDDDSDLLGYADTVNSVYRPGDSGLVEALVDASLNSDKLYLICFDEMNLSKVEHYFSQFLSVLEMEDSSDRSITLYNKELEPKLYNSQNYPSSIKIGRNVLFVGTVNTDESTHRFSDKVLDRANVIELNMRPFHDVNISQEEIQTPNLKNAKPLFSATDFNKFKEKKSENSLSLEEKKFLWHLHQHINRADKNIGIGWRIIKSIDAYLSMISDNSIDRKEAFDLQLVQRVLTKIRGPEQQLTPLLGDYEKQIDGEIINIFNEFSDISDFNYSKYVIKQKSKELHLHGYTT